MAVVRGQTKTPHVQTDIYNNNNTTSLLTVDGVSYKHLLADGVSPTREFVDKSQAVFVEFCAQRLYATCVSYVTCTRRVIARPSWAGMCFFPQTVLLTHTQYYRPEMETWENPIDKDNHNSNYYY